MQIVRFLNEEILLQFTKCENGEIVRSLLLIMHINIDKAR